MALLTNLRGVASALRAPCGPLRERCHTWRLNAYICKDEKFIFEPCLKFDFSLLNRHNRFFTFICHSFFLIAPLTRTGTSASKSQCVKWSWFIISWALGNKESWAKYSTNTDKISYGCISLVVAPTLSLSLYGIKSLHNCSTSELPVIQLNCAFWATVDSSSLNVMAIIISDTSFTRGGGNKTYWPICNVQLLHITLVCFIFSLDGAQGRRPATPGKERSGCGAEAPRAVSQKKWQ